MSGDVCELKEKKLWYQMVGLEKTIFSLNLLLLCHPSDAAKANSFEKTTKNVDSCMIGLIQ